MKFLPGKCALQYSRVSVHPGEGNASDSAHNEGRILKIRYITVTMDQTNQRLSHCLFLKVSINACTEAKEFQFCPRQYRIPSGKFAFNVTADKACRLCACLHP
jgi:hypothetical protein